MAILPLRQLSLSESSRHFLYVGINLGLQFQGLLSQLLIGQFVQIPIKAEYRRDCLFGFLSFG
jgi:hypothetical protein